MMMKKCLSKVELLNDKKKNLELYIKSTRLKKVALALSILFCLNIIGWYIDEDKYEIMNDNKIYLSHEEALNTLVKGTVTTNKRYYYTQQVIYIRKRSKIPYFYNRDTIQKSKKQYYSELR